MDKDEYIRAYNERVLALISRDIKEREREKERLARERGKAEKERAEDIEYYWQKF